MIGLTTKPRPWSQLEDDMLMAYYPSKGPRWLGWSDVLPDRSAHAITSRANKIGLVTEANEERTRKMRLAAVSRNPMNRGRLRRNTRMPSFVKDPYEEQVFACLTARLTPSEIDKKYGWKRGTARQIITDAWQRDKSKGEVNG